MSPIRRIIVAVQLYRTPKIAYVDASKLMVGFSEAVEVERELNAGDKKWREQLKELELSTPV